MLRAIWETSSVWVETGPIMIAGQRPEHLRLVLQAPERLAVNHTIPIALERRANRILRLSPGATAAVGALRGTRRGCRIIELPDCCRRLMHSDSRSSRS